MIDEQKTELARFVEALRVARLTAVELSAQLAEKQALFDAEHATLLADIAANKTAIKNAEEWTRHHGLLIYRHNGDTAPFPGVTVKVEKEYVYTDVAALAWLKTFAPGLIYETFHRDTFEDMVKPMFKNKIAVPCVVVAETPKVSIAKKLEAVPVVPDVVTPETPPVQPTNDFPF